jgi:CDP-glucose 4,6-dehydratase
VKVSKPLDFEAKLAGRHVFVTGHTGFTGSWACLWLKQIGCRVTGFSLPPQTDPSLFEAAGVADDTSSHLGDICEYETLRAAVAAAQPDLVLHLAAQPLVRRSYREPLQTFLTNVQGTAHILDAARSIKTIRGVLCITTDKVYENREWAWPYREDDPLGGRDPYSASKAAAEMVARSFAVSYPWSAGAGPAVAVARGGNIIGGGDWSEDRLIPDFVRAAVGGHDLEVRNPDATRPWQHVLALVQGYLTILGGLIEDDPQPVARAWNLGPFDANEYSVRDVLDLLSATWMRPRVTLIPSPLHEAQSLALDSSLARNRLGWRPAWDTARVVRETAAWYRGYYADPSSARALTLAQLDAWRADLT